MECGHTFSWQGQDEENEGEDRRDGGGDGRWLLGPPQLRVLLSLGTDRQHRSKQMGRGEKEGGQQMERSYVDMV